MQDPIEYKKELNKIAKEFATLDPAEQAGKDLSKMKPQSKEIITETSMKRPVATNDQFEHLLKIMIKNYEA